MLCYKVIRWRDGTPVSIFADGDLQVRYMVGEYVTAPKFAADLGYHLLVFESLRAARRFAPADDIFRAECKDEIPLPPMHRQDMVEMGRLDGGGLVTRDGTWFEGTKMFKTIKLLSRVFPEDEE